MGSEGKLTLPADCARRYEPVRVLGRGGFGAAVLAFDRQLARSVVIKVLFGAEADTVARFTREARLTANLHHENVVKVLDHGAEDGIPWIAYEYVEGRTLRQRMDDGRFTPAEAIEIVLQVARALEAAHAHAIIHRDVKPENVLEEKGGRYRLIDFGIAKGGSGRTVDTSPGLVLGSPGYLSPETIRGDPIDHRTDLYSLGVVLFELLTGRPPFISSSALQVLASHVNEPPPHVRRFTPDCPPALEVLVARLLAKLPDDRVGSAADLVEELARMRAPASPAPPGPRAGTAPLATGASGGAHPVSPQKAVTAASRLAIPIAPRAAVPGATVAGARHTRAAVGASGAHTPGAAGAHTAGPSGAQTAGTSGARPRGASDASRGAARVRRTARLRRALVLAGAALAVTAAVLVAVPRRESANRRTVPSAPAASGNAAGDASPAPAALDAGEVAAVSRQLDAIYARISERTQARIAHTSSMAQSPDNFLKLAGHGLPAEVVRACATDYAWLGSWLESVEQRWPGGVAAHDRPLVLRARVKRYTILAYLEDMDAEIKVEALSTIDAKLYGQLKGCQGDACYAQLAEYFNRLVPALEACASEPGLRAGAPAMIDDHLQAARTCYAYGWCEPVRKKLLRRTKEEQDLLLKKAAEGQLLGLLCKLAERAWSRAENKLIPALMVKSHDEAATLLATQRWLNPPLQEELLRAVFPER